MIGNNNVSLPYPVLGLEGDFKEGGFVVKPSIQVLDDELHIVEGEVEITNEYIKKLFDNEEVTTAYRIVCSSTLYSRSVYNEKEIVIPMDLLANHIEIEVFLVANTDIPIYSDDSFNDDYSLGNTGGVFKLNKGNIIGFAGSKNIPLKKSFAKGASSMFSFKRGEDLTMSFNVEEGDQIVITYPYDASQQLDITSVMPKSNKMTFLNLFILPALNRAFLELCNQDESGDLQDFKENNEWAMILTETYPNWNDDDTYRSAQNYLQDLLSGQGKMCKIPVLEAFEELKR